MTQIKAQPNKRIVLIHALADSLQPSQQAFAQGWPQAKTYNLMDDSLSKDLSVEGTITDRMINRFLMLGTYAESTGALDQRTHAILFACSAFGPAIDKVKAALPIPVLRPNEAAFEMALNVGSRIALLVSFEHALPPLLYELQCMAQARQKHIEITTAVASGALAALKAGDGAAHDAIVAKTADSLRNVDALVLCQFSLARAFESIEHQPGRTVLTTPDSAVQKIKSLLNQG